MRNFLSDYGIESYINAHDTITLYGASRMSENTWEAMRQISQTFVDISQLQKAVDIHIARLTHNEDAYVANSAAGAIALCAAVCMANENEAVYRALPNTSGLKNEIIVFHGQHNCYDKALLTPGAQIRLVGDADTVLAIDYSAAITERTAAVFYCPSINFEGASLPLATVCEIAHEKGVPVIVDAAARLPPVENLWEYTATGADMVIFSGGKTLCGPQTSGLIVGKAKYMSLCRKYGAPMHGICRSLKPSREGIIGLCAAIESFINADHEKIKAENYIKVNKMLAAMKGCALYSPYLVEHGSVGQSYPRAFAAINAPLTAQSVIAKMRKKNIYIGFDKLSGAIYLSPQNLTESECELVCKALCEIDTTAEK